jgi:hypothetical protein
MRRHARTMVPIGLGVGLVLADVAAAALWSHRVPGASRILPARVVRVRPGNDGGGWHRHCLGPTPFDGWRSRMPPPRRLWSSPTRDFRSVAVSDRCAVYRGCL